MKHDWREFTCRRCGLETKNPNEERRACKTDNLRFDAAEVSDRPPLGLMLRKFVEQARLRDIYEAMERYAAAGKACPVAWVEEARELSGYKVVADEEDSNPVSPGR